MAKIKLVVSATIEETFSDFIIFKKTKGLAEKTLQSYQSQFQDAARHMDVKVGIALLQKADLDAMIISMRDASLPPIASTVIHAPSNPFSLGAMSKVLPASIKELICAQRRSVLGNFVRTVNYDNITGISSKIGWVFQGCNARFQSRRDHQLVRHIGI